MRNVRWLVVAGLLMAVLIVALTVVIRLQSTAPASQRVTLPDGGVVEFFDVTHGTNHISGSATARFFARMPKLVLRTLAAVGAKIPPVQQRFTSKPELLVWYRYTPPPGAASGRTSFAMRIADETGFVSGKEASLFAFASGGFEAGFEVFPRRSKHLTLVVSDHSGNTNNLVIVTNILNPLYTAVGHWTPEPLPATKRAEDLEVTLSSFTTGVGMGTTWTKVSNQVTVSFGPQSSGGENYSVFKVGFRHGTNSNPPWTVAGEVLSDATGNSIANRSMGGSGPGVYTVAPSLWPNEAAWKLKLILKRTGNFATNELFTFKDVPVGDLNVTNSLAMVTNVQGTRITLKHFLLRPPITNENSWSGDEVSKLKLVHDKLPDGAYLDLVEARSGTNKLQSTGWSRGSTEQEYSFRNVPADTKTFDVTFALHPSRSVEFLVKPTVRDPAMMQMRE